MQKKARRERSKVKENARREGKAAGTNYTSCERRFIGRAFSTQARTRARAILFFIPAALSGFYAWVSLDDSILPPQNTHARPLPRARAVMGVSWTRARETR